MIETIIDWIVSHFIFAGPIAAVFLVKVLIWSLTTRESCRKESDLSHADSIETPEGGVYLECPLDSVVLYLDFDGVLHRRVNESFERMPLLEELLHNCPKMMVVISSSWRETMSFDGLVNIFPDRYRCRIKGVTPSLKNTMGVEYVRYVECINHAKTLGVNRIIIIDDEVFRFPPECNHLVATNYCEGMTQETIDEVIMMYHQFKV